MCAVQDFLTVCCPEVGTNAKTLGVLPTTTIEQLAEQCAARFEQGECLEDTSGLLYFCFIHRNSVPYLIQHEYDFYNITLEFKPFKREPPMI